MVTYKLKSLYCEDSPIFVGEKNIKNRKCRFCGKGVTEGATFNNVAHAISESLGNKYIFALDECDDCNNSLSKIEQHLSNYLSVMLYLYDIEGKPSRKRESGIRKIKTPDCEFDTQDRFKTVILTDKEINNLIDSINNNEFYIIQSPLKFNKYIPINVYKAFCKYAINLIADEDLNKFSKLRNWIAGQSEISFKPIILCAPFPMSGKNPNFVYFTQTDSLDKPFCLCCFQISNIIFAIEIPSDTTFYIKDNSSRLEALNALVKWLFPNLPFQEMDLSGKKLETMDLKFEMNIPTQLQEGKDYFYANSKEEVNKLIDKFGLNLPKSNN